MTKVDLVAKRRENQVASKKGSRKAKASAFDLWKSWTTAGVPDLITSHEAHRLTSGKIGEQGDHSSPLQTKLVAVAAVKKGVAA